MFRLSIIALAALAGSLPLSATAQQAQQTQVPVAQTSSGVAAGAPTTLSSATIGESQARGLADTVRAAGASNLMNSEAAINYEQARALNFENRLRFTEGYFQQQKLNAAYRQEARGQRPTTEQLFRIAKNRAPDPLSPSEFDPYSGDVRWPTLLLSTDYAADRVTVEDLMRKRAIDAIAMTAADQAALRAALDALAERMRSNIGVYDPNEYTTAKNFLQSLAATAGAGAVY
jgi:hypothetical protein